MCKASSSHRIYGFGLVLLLTRAMSAAVKPLRPWPAY